MSFEEMQRTMQFLLNQQAKFASDFELRVERMDQGLDRLTEKTERIADGLIRLTESQRDLIRDQERIWQWIELHLQRDHGYPKA